MYRRMHAHLLEPNNLHPAQTGFSKGKSTLHNINTVIDTIARVRESMQLERVNKVPAIHRTK